jgi:hypothetical protein
MAARLSNAERAHPGGSVLEAGRDLPLYTGSLGDQQAQRYITGFFEAF